jgi:hypothetical protein
MGIGSSTGPVYQDWPSISPLTSSKMPQFFLSFSYFVQESMVFSIERGLSPPRGMNISAGPCMLRGSSKALQPFRNHANAGISSLGMEEYLTESKV